MRKYLYFSDELLRKYDVPNYNGPFKVDLLYRNNRDNITVSSCNTSFSLKASNIKKLPNIGLVPNLEPTSYDDELRLRKALKEANANDAENLMQMIKKHTSS